MVSDPGTGSKGPGSVAEELKHDVGSLERQVNELSRSLSSVLTEKDLRDYILTIKRPGWTTPAEFLFATGIVSAMQAQVQVLGDLKQTLFDGSRQVSGR